MAKSLELTSGKSLELSTAAVSESNPNGGLLNLFAAVGWDTPEEVNGQTMDFDLAAIIKKNDGSPSEMVYFNNLTSSDGSLQHTGDNLTGAGDGDDEIINIDLVKVSPTVQEIEFVAIIYDAVNKKQSLANLQNGFIRIVNKDNNEELAKFNLQTQANGIGFALGSLTRNPNDSNAFLFTANGSVLAQDLNTYAQSKGFKRAA